MVGRLDVCKVRGLVVCKVLGKHGFTQRFHCDRIPARYVARQPTPLRMEEATPHQYMGLSFIRSLTPGYAASCGCSVLRSFSLRNVW